MPSRPLLLSRRHESHKTAFHGQTKTRRCSLCLAFEAVGLLIEFIIPALEKARMASSHSVQGSPTPRLPALVLHPPPIPDKQPFFLPLCRRSWSHRRSVLSSEPGEATGRDGSLRSPGVIVAPNAVHAATSFVFSSSTMLWRKCSWGVGAARDHTQTRRLSRRQSSQQLEGAGGRSNGDEGLIVAFVCSA